MLPIYEIEADLVRQLRAGNRLLLSAPPGSGKTTQVPQMLLRAGLLAADRQIVILQPRRLATRMVARRVAQEMGARVGDLVGYQTRHDSQVSAATRVRFVTEGLFLRQIQADPRLRGVGAVILDEFHERSLPADTSLALLRRTQETLRPDLKLIVMSATLDVERVGQYLRAPLLTAAGRTFPVAVNYLERRSQAPPWELAADALAAVLEGGEEGDVLIFMPGGYEIRRTLEACRRVAPGERIEFLPLHGELPVQQQDAALRASEHRKVIVSTNVAETSITIEGVRHVIDSGLARVNRFDPRRGINVLLVEPVSQSSTEQRAGRAGRTCPGTCHRLWSEAEQRSRPMHDTPEILRLDLAEVVLQLKALGIGELREFPWLDAPAAPAVDQAERALQSIDALGEAGQITPLGKSMATFPMHPRLSRMLAEAGKRGCLARAVLWAALISDRDILIRGQASGGGGGGGGGGGSLREAASESAHRSDFLVLEKAFAAAAAADFDVGRCAGLGVHANACRQAEQTRRQYMEVCEDAGLRSAGESSPASGTASDPRGRSESAVSSHDHGARRHGRLAPPPGVAGRATPASPPPAAGEIDEVLRCLLVAYVDHVAFRRNGDNPACALVGNRRGVLDAGSVAQRPGLLLTIDIREVTGGARDSGGVKTVLSLASEVEADWLREVHPERVRVQHVTLWNAQMQAVERVEQHLFDDLVFDQTQRPETDVDAAAGVLADLVFKGELKLEKWDEDVEQWIARTRCVADWFPERRLLRYDDDDRRVILREICGGAVRFSQVQGRACLPAVKAALSWEDQQFVEKMAPERMSLPGAKNNWRMKVEYQPGGLPRGRAKIQDLYGLNASPTVAGGRQRVLLEILGPNYRPVQTTDDLAGFWKNLYPTLKKELSRKYPRHEWR